MNDDTFTFACVLVAGAVYVVTGFDGDETVWILWFLNLTVLAVFVPLAVYGVVTSMMEGVDQSPISSNAREEASCGSDHLDAVATSVAESDPSLNPMQAPAETSCWSDHVHIARWYGGNIPAPTSRGAATAGEAPVVEIGATAHSIHLDDVPEDERRAG